MFKPKKPGASAPGFVLVRPVERTNWDVNLHEIYTFYFFFEIFEQRGMPDPSFTGSIQHLSLSEFLVGFKHGLHPFIVRKAHDNQVAFPVAGDKDGLVFTVTDFRDFDGAIAQVGNRSNQGHIILHIMIVVIFFLQ
ncbi:MAG: hypothetical protein WAL90_05050 [Desulfobacterales bacterium]